MRCLCVVNGQDQELEAVGRLTGNMVHLVEWGHLHTDVYQCRRCQRLMIVLGSQQVWFLPECFVARFQWSDDAPVMKGVEEKRR